MQLESYAVHPGIDNQSADGSSCSGKCQCLPDQILWMTRHERHTWAKYCGWELVLNRMVMLAFRAAGAWRILTMRAQRGPMPLKSRGSST